MNGEYQIFNVPPGKYEIGGKKPKGFIVKPLILFDTRQYITVEAGEVAVAPTKYITIPLKITSPIKDNKLKVPFAVTWKPCKNIIVYEILVHRNTNKGWSPVLSKHTDKSMVRITEEIEPGEIQITVSGFTNERLGCKKSIKVVLMK